MDNKILAIGLLIALSSCERAPPQMDDESIYDRSQLVRSCLNGMKVGRDPISKRLTWSTNWSQGVVEAGIKLEDVCQS